MEIELQDVSHIYNEGNAFEKVALKNINLTIGENEFIGIIGHTGSGKSTLVQHLNALNLPTSGDIFVDGINTKEDGQNKRNIRKNVGLVFQYPEYQLFEETIYKDIAFGPGNLGCSEEEIEERVKWACKMVDLDFERAKEVSPFDVSGGQKRRAAIAGVLAMKPKFLVLDEPTAGLDPKGRDDILENINNLYKEENMTIILVSHSMEEIARLVNRIIVLEHGEILMDGKPKEVFARHRELREVGLNVPQITQLMIMLKERGMDVPTDVLTVDEGERVLKEFLRRSKC
ncbi:energy-coupling factor transporter ATPase [Lagierella massiliensis]|uniref:energy-coupling factor transporter ATPase n=1 Tax=Lagierella massiliensis TaxID=1689303 RepID=UPI0006D804A4|nr:energy-coupling factor transporter ATPase [Lagierella massiliensis]